MAKRLWRLLFSRWRAWSLFFKALTRHSLFYPLAKVSVGGTITIGRRATLKKVLLDAGTGLITVGDGVWANDGVELSASRKIVLGPGTTLQRNVTINGDVVVGAGCLFGPNVFVSSSSHVHDQYPGITIREQERRISRDDFLALYDKPIIIGDDVWLGVNSVLMPGISVGSHAIIGANAVVTRSVPQGAIVAGSPAKLIKFRLGFEGVQHVE
ncbi:acyltransferase [Pseudomonas sp. nanlin1]|uniref:acyltransferase n=1 Tax=Pseudomonas sp. nanlin1 TaxID=3040605 RepID=UPI00388DEE7F